MLYIGTEQQIVTYRQKDTMKYNVHNKDGTKQQSIIYTKM